jgi:hypothetical protein
MSRSRHLRKSLSRVLRPKKNKKKVKKNKGEENEGKEKLKENLQES